MAEALEEIRLNTRWTHIKHMRKRYRWLRCLHIEYFTVTVDLYDAWVDTATRAGRRIVSFAVQEGYYLIGLR